jgi:CPA2 family monovalent cation:H+ antiporter-2
MHPAVPASGYKDLVLFLAIAGVVAPLFKRLKISPVLGFLIAGVVLGPFGLGRLSHALPWLTEVTVTDPGEMDQLAEFGVVFLLFMIGLELSWGRLRRMRRLVFGLGLAQVALTAATLFAIARFGGLSLPAAASIGAALALSSTAIVMPVLAEGKRLQSVAGRATFAVLLFQDLAVAPIVVTLGVIGHAKSGFDPRLLLTFVPAVIGIVLIVVIGRLALRPMLKSVARAKSQELFVAACLLVVISAGLAAAAAGLSMAVGAFVAGLLLAETEYRHEVEVTIEPFKGLLLGLFFVSVGLSLNLERLAVRPVQILGLCFGLIAAKAAITFLAARIMRMKAPVAAETSLSLAAGGEFAFVILSTAIAAGVIPRHMGQSVVMAATLSMFAIPALSALGARLGRQADAPATVPPAVAADGPARVLVVGYGRVGRMVGEMLTRHDIPWAAVDRDARSAEAARAGGAEVFFGDASRTEFLVRLGVESARALVVTMDSPDAAEATVAAARALRSDLTIVARARDTRHAQRLYALGATDVVPETVEASLQLSEAVLIDIGTPMGLVIASIHERRDEYRKLLNRPDAPSNRLRRARDALRGRTT